MEQIFKIYAPFLRYFVCVCVVVGGGGGGNVKQQSEDTASAIKVITTSTDASHLKSGIEIEHKHTYKVCLKY